MSISTNSLLAVAASVISCGATASAAVVWVGNGDAGARLDSGVSVVNFASSNFPGSAIALSSGVGAASASISEVGMTLEAISTNRFGSSVSLDAVAFVGADTEFTASWHDLARRSVSLQIAQVSASNQILGIVFSTDATAGSDHLQLLAGNYYRFLFDFAAAGSSTAAHVEATFTSSSAPAPGALALLAPAGLLARRRRA
jgi:hypothetical protein